MTKTFSITSPSRTVTASRGRGSSTRFTVRNTSDVTVRGRAILVPMHGAADSWLSIDRGVERDFGPEQADEFDVQIRVPSDADPGRYSLRLDMVAVHDPDEDYTAGPEVAIEVDTEPPPVVKQPAKGYLATLVGTAVGAAAAAAVVGIVVAAVVLVTGSVDDLTDNLGTNVITIMLLIPGPWIGATAGSGLALRIRGYQAVVATSVAMAVLFPVWTIVMFFGVSMTGVIDSDGGGLLLIVGVLIPPLAISLPAFLSRFLALTLTSSR